ncbi:MAG: UbiA family prenyltransferase [Deltaproteobacteria bacterium]|nr:UbiA family prenyltransferase [Deltaproteobacteria bacterium]
MTPAAPSTNAAKEETSFVSEALSIARYHIMLVAMFAAVVFGWIATGHRFWALTIVVALDWFLINLMNRITDIEEDLKNGIPGTERVARRKRALTIASVVLMAGSFAVTHLVWPMLTPFRVAVQVIGLGYNYDLVPTPKGLSRFKEIYFLKNFGSSVLFVLTCFVYPLAANGFQRVVPWSTIIVLALFFVPFELTYEILYDMRDLEGDRAEGIPTYPVVHGMESARRIIDALLVSSTLVLVAGFLARVIGVRELLMVFAPIAQLLFYRPRYLRGLTSRDCIVLTHLGSAQLALFVIGTTLWLRAGLPANVFLPP